MPIQNVQRFETVADVFGANLFSTTSLTNSINLLPEVPRQFRTLGINDENSIRTTKHLITRQGEALRLVPSAPDGAEGLEYTRTLRDAIQIERVNLPQQATIYAAELQDLLSYGHSQDQLAALKEVIDDHLRRMRNDNDATMEYRGVGLLKGKVTDADHTTVLLDLFEKFGFEAYTPVEIDPAPTADNEAPIQATMAEVSRMIYAVVQVVFGGVYVLAGKDLCDKVRGSKEYRESHKYDNAELLRTRKIFKPFEYADAIWEEYRGSVGGVPFIAPDEGYAFPFLPPETGSLFQTRWTPSPTFRGMNQKAVPYYVNVQRDTAEDPRWIKLLASAHPIDYCAFPRAIVPLKLKP